MFYNTTAHHRARRAYFLTIASRSWQMFADLRAARRTRAQLSRLDDYMLKDIGLTRGSIDSAIRKGHLRD